MAKKSAVSPTRKMKLERLPSVISRTGLSRTSIWRKSGVDFPAFVRISPAAVAWVSDEIDAWIADRMNARSVKTPPAREIHSRSTISLGDRVRCTESGFRGTAISRTEFAGGRVNYYVVPDRSPRGLDSGIFIEQNNLEPIPHSGGEIALEDGALI